MIRFYHYNKCGTCRKAKKFLDQQNVIYEEIDITRNPPPKSVLKKAIEVYNLKRLFNTSGIEYREKKIKDKIDFMTEIEAINLLSKNGRLIKRPIIVDDTRVTIGFSEEEFKRTWSN